jgi:hypothetical protein
VNQGQQEKVVESSQQHCVRAPSPGARAVEAAAVQEERSEQGGADAGVGVGCRLSAMQGAGVMQAGSSGTLADALGSTQPPYQSMRAIEGTRHVGHAHHLHHLLKCCQDPDKGCE